MQIRSYVCFNGDTFLDLEVSKLEAHWQANHLPIIVGKNVADTARYGRLETEGQRVIGFTGKNIPGPGLINAGCYVVPAHLLDSFELNQAFSLEADFLEFAVKSQHFGLFVTNGFFIDIGVPKIIFAPKPSLTGSFHDRPSGPLS